MPHPSSETCAVRSQKFIILTNIEQIMAEIENQLLQFFTKKGYDFEGAKIKPLDDIRVIIEEAIERNPIFSQTLDQKTNNNFALGITNVLLEKFPNRPRLEEALDVKAVGFARAMDLNALMLLGTASKMAKALVNKSTYVVGNVPKEKSEIVNLRKKIQGAINTIAQKREIGEYPQIRS